MVDAAPVPAPWLAERLQVRPVAHQPVAGGSIHQAWCLTVEALQPLAPQPCAPTCAPISAPDQPPPRRRLFAKTNRSTALPLLEAEAEGLAALARFAPDCGLTVPEPLALGVSAGRAVLILPWLDLDGAGPGGEAGWRRLGAGLARLHQRSLERDCIPGDRRDAFGWPRDNVIGAGTQRNGWDQHWARFFAERRLAPQLQWLAAAGRPLRGAERLLERVPVWLASHSAQPCLVHGDLWSGNAGLTAEGGAALFDPAVHRADREVDLAMARLFGGFPTAFFTAYAQTWPLLPGHRQRVPLYNLYHLLNHANLFGGSYCAQAQACIDQLLAEG